MLVKTFFLFFWNLWDGDLLNQNINQFQLAVISHHYWAILKWNNHLRCFKFYYLIIIIRQGRLSIIIFLWPNCPNFQISNDTFGTFFTNCLTEAQLIGKWKNRIENDTATVFFQVLFIRNWSFCHMYLKFYWTFHHEKTVWNCHIYKNAPNP